MNAVLKLSQSTVERRSGSFLERLLGRSKAERHAFAF